VCHREKLKIYLKFCPRLVDTTPESFCTSELNPPYVYVLDGTISDKGVVCQISNPMKTANPATRGSGDENRYFPTIKALPSVSRLPSVGMAEESQQWIYGG
jgi:hypothetical protein